MTEAKNIPEKNSKVAEGELLDAADDKVVPPEEAISANSTISGDGDVNSSAEDQNGEQLIPYEDLVVILNEAEHKAAAYSEQLLRNQAELENIRRRGKRDLENAHKYALEKIASELLPVKDSLEMGLNASAQDGIDVEKVTEGLELTLKMLSSVMNKFGIEEVDPLQEPFDPERHQAMSVQEVDNVESDTVIAVYQKGYLLNERLLRPAMVVVAKGCGSSNDATIDELA